jgi:hypothetical protein
VIANFPRYELYLLSSGFTNTATQAGINSGLVVAMMISPPPSTSKRMSLKNASSSFSSVSACAIVV